MKKIAYGKFVILFVICFIHIISMVFVVFSGTIIHENDDMKYITNEGKVATSSWVWLDVDNDSILEYYRFDENGYLDRNYKDKFGKETNELGQLVNNGIIVQKFMSNGKIMLDKGMPNVIVDEKENYRLSDNVILNGKITPKEEGINNEVITTLRTMRKDLIGPGVENNQAYMYLYGLLDNVNNNESNVIYSMGSDGTSNVVSNNNGEEIVAGKDIKKYIVKKVGCKTDVEKAYIYGGDIWENVIELRGNESFIDIDLKNNNYIYFEVACDDRVVDEVDSNLSLFMYVDNELVDTIDEFNDGESIKYDNTFYDNEKKVKLMLKIDGKKHNRRVYIKNGRLKKIKIDED